MSLAHHLPRYGRHAAAGAAVLAFLALGTSAANAQQRDWKPKQPDVGDTAKVTRRGFSLFANADLAAAGMKMTGSFGWGLSNLGPCADAFQLFSTGSTGQGCGAVFVDGAWSFHLYDVGLTAAAGPTEWNKIVASRPEAAASLRGQPFSHLWVQTTSNARQEFGPADNTLGRLFSGVASTNDGSCRDHTGNQNADLSTGVTLLATSDCPATWASGGFRGPRLISDSAFIQLREQQGSGFSFDFWQVPQLPGDTALLGDYSTYGQISDHYSEMVANYGGITKLGTGTASIGGFPLGLDIEFQAFRFARPSLQNVVYWQMTVVNRSDRLYGTGVDYDSLYMGLTFSMGGYQTNSNYYVPSRGALLSNESGTNTGCNGAIGPIACSNLGFVNGPIGWIFLKSPIGDLRNKLLSIEGTPFYDPANPHRDDTLTFNHAHSCNFGSTCSLSTSYQNDRRGFGMNASSPLDVLDGRAVTALTSNTYWYTFRNKAWPNARPVAFNRFVPGATSGYGAWDYNNDGQQDTLFLDTCAENGCVTTWADTMPGKQSNSRSNDAAMMTAGPFALGVGDTTSFIFAFVGAPDSLMFEQQIDNATEAYLNFFRIPQPPPPSVVVSSAAEPAGLGTPRVRIFFTTPATNYVDPFLAAFASTLRTGNPPSRAILDSLNPNLADSIEARANANLDRILVFKSCDNGNTFTANDGNCVGDPRPGTPLGWAPYAELTPDPETGRINNQFIDNNVQAGRTYLYSFVAVSRGFTTSVIDLVNGVQVARQLEVAPVVSGAIQRTGPTTAKIYVPINFAAGTRASTFAVRTLAGDSATVPLTIRIGQAAPSGSYELIFGNRFIIRTRTLRSGAVTSRVVVQDVVDFAKVGTAPAVEDFVTDSTVLTSTQAVPVVTSPETDRSSGTLTTADSTVVTDTISGFGFALATTDGRVLFVSTNLNPGETTPSDFLSSAGFPGVFITTDPAGAFEFVAADERIITAGNDTITNIIASAVNYRNDLSAASGGPRPLNDPSGIYQVIFADDAFGPDSPFTLDFATPSNTQAALTASLNARPVVTTGATGDSIEAALEGTIFEGMELVAAKFPFRVVNRTTGDTALLAMPLRTELGRTNTILLGAGTDTIRFQVPADVWVPGDQFAVIERPLGPQMVGDSVVIGGNGQPVLARSLVVRFAPFLLGCGTTRASCNPLVAGSRGSSGYYAYRAGDRLEVNFRTPFSLSSRIALDVSAPATEPGRTASDLKLIRVVPNPYVVQSQFDAVNASSIGDPRIYFSGVPSSGQIRVYSVSGQFLQQITWTAADLNGTGDLPWNLRTREGLDLATGLYIYVLTAKDDNGRNLTHRGKFVVIR